MTRARPADVPAAPAGPAGAAFVAATDEDVRQVREIWAGRSPAGEPWRPLHRLVHARAVLDPELAAVRDGPRSLTYRELSAAAGALAGRLRAGGVGPGDVVAVHAAPSAELVVAMLGVLTAGAAYLPLDRGDPPGRLADVVRDAGARVLLSDDPAPAWQPADTTVEPIEVIEPGEPAGGPRAGAGVLLDAGRPAYVIYTSGSTGGPKGVLCHHRGIVNLLADFIARRPLPLGARCALWTSPAFDVSVYEIFSALLGGTLVIVPAPVRTDVPAVLDLLAREDVGSAYLPPFMLPDLAQRLARRPMPRLSRLLVGVEPIPEGLLLELVRRCPDLHVINGYGPTEAHVCATAYSVTRRTADPADPHRRAPIGTPLRGVTAHVLGPDGSPVADGEVGELYVGGTGVALGYVNRDEETARRFLPDPFAGRPAARMYRTGDLVSRLPGGDLLFHGRSDDQVKVNGFRVEPAEVETELLRLPAVDRAAAVVRRTPAGARLEAFVTVRGPAAAGTGRPSGPQLREALAGRLPPHLVPALVHVLPGLPTNRNGKLDRAALSDAAASAVGPAAPPAPRSVLEGLIVRLAEDVLGLGPLSPDAGFVAAGGDSIAAMRLATRIGQQARRPASTAEVLGCDTLADLAALLAGRPEVEPPPPALPAAGGRQAPVSPAQHGLWLLHRLHPGCTAYHVPLLLRLRGALDRAALAAAVRDLVLRHQALRTTFPVVGDGPVRRVAAPDDLSAELLPMREPAPGGTAEDLLAELVTAPFDLARGPLVRATLIPRAADEHLLLLVVHHLVTDGWSMEILQRDLGIAYTARVTGTSPDRSPAPAGPPEPASPADSAAREARDLVYWREQLADLPADPALPEVRPPAPRPRFAGRQVRRRVAPSTARALDRIARGEGASLFSVLAAALAVVLARYAGQEQLMVGTPAAGRDFPGAEDAVGFFNQTLPLRLDLRGDPTFRRLTRRVHRTLADALEHASVPFEQVVAAVSPRSGSGRSPLFRVWVNLLSYPRHPVAAAGLEVAPADAPLAGSLYDLCLYAEPDGDGLALTLVFDPDVLADDRTARLADQLCNVLDQIAADPGRPVARLELEAAEPPAAVRPAGPPGVRTPAEGIRRPAEPDRVAVRAPGTALTYRSLRAEVDEVAAALHAAGVAAGDLVAVLTGRTAQLPVALLAVRATGAGYAVLDPAQPGAWLERSVRSAAPRVWLAGAGVAPPHVVASPHTAPAARAAGSGGLTLWPADPRQPPCRLPEHAAYVAFTSGSTGRPRAVLGAEDPVLRFLHWYAAELGLGPADRFSVLAGLGHDPMLRELLLPLVLGATACLPPPQVLPVPDRLLEWLASARITVLHLTPAVARLLAAAGRAAGRALPDARLVALGGAAVGPELPAVLRELCPGARLLSLYGTTETPQGVGVVDLAAEFSTGRRFHAPPVGTGVPDAQLLVVDRQLRAAAVNEIGEIVVRGTQLALGYLDDPGGTAERFHPDPWGAAGVRLFRTGDRGRRRPDGVVEFLGRTDDQLSINGQRVEPADIEQAARECSGVQECAVVAGDGRDGPVLYVAPDHGTPHEGLVERVVLQLAQALPAAMQPAVVRAVPTVPLTPNGKVDRAALAAVPERAGPAGPAPPGADGDAPARMLALWRSVLGRPDVSADTNFFDAGGTSVTLLRLQQVLEAELGRPVELLSLFQFPTAGRLAAALAAGRGADRSGRPDRAVAPGGGSRREQRLALRRLARDRS